MGEVTGLVECRFEDESLPSAIIKSVGRELGGFELSSARKKVLEEKEARELLEAVRWPDGPICPHCLVMSVHYRVNPRKGSRSPVRQGVWKCRDCRKQFTVTVGTVFHGSKIPLRKWLIAISLICSPEESVNAHQLHRRLGITYKSAWFMARRIHEAMKQGSLIKKVHGVIEVEKGYSDGNGRSGRGLVADTKTRVLTAVESRGSARSSVIERLRGEYLLGFARKTWRGFSRVWSVTD